MSVIRQFLLLALSCVSLWGHTQKPAYLEIKSKQNNTYKIKWKVPLMSTDEKISISPVFPSNCKENNTSYYRDNRTVFTSALLHCKHTLLNKTITIKNIENTTQRVIFHFSQDNTSFFTELNPIQPNITIKESHTSYNTLDYISLGIEHILIGYDHLLFVLGLLLLIQKFKILIQTITAFTIAHSITLGASVIGVVTLSKVFIEILIAFSIVILAVEVLYAHQGKVGISSKYPWAVALFFGLVHGFGFANVLAELTLPKEYFIQSLLFFNIGIEIGQLFFISIVVSCYILLKYFMNPKHLIKSKILLVYTIGGIASYWFIERLAGVI